jgi:antibiotic biosynthesis monooxygenase (ABM) superfamily enzyme
MKNFSLPRLALVLWFAFYSLLMMINYLFGGHHGIMEFIVYSAVMTSVFLIGLGFIEDMA